MNALNFADHEALDAYVATMDRTKESLCWCHYEVEPIPPNAYIVCGECGHVWTAKALRRAWHHAYPLPKLSLWRDDEFDHARPFRWLRAVRHRWFKRATRIYFCQECIHDF
jgi:hypothetical protein